jgi:hypothetical protein
MTRNHIPSGAQVRVLQASLNGFLFAFIWSINKLTAGVAYDTFFLLFGWVDLVVWSVRPRDEHHGIVFARRN